MLATSQSTYNANATPGTYPGMNIESISLTIVEGKNLKDTDAIGKADYYFIVRAGTNKVQSKVLKSSSPNPQWNEKLELKVLPGDTEVIVDVMDKDKFSADDFIGRVTLPTSELCRGNIDRFFPLLDKAGKSVGELRLSIHPVGSVSGAIHDAVHGHGQTNPLGKLKQKLKGNKKGSGSSSSDSD